MSVGETVPTEPFAVREATERDLDRVLDTERRAFGHDDEADLVRALLADSTAAPRLSLLAVADGRCIGHVLFTAVTLTGAARPVTASLLAPLAVVPEAQGRGCGTQLVESGLQRLGKVGVDLVFVLGHPTYYPRFGFKPAGRRGFEAPYPIPQADADAWMVMALRPDGLESVSGRVKVADALARPEYWR